MLPGLFSPPSRPMGLSPMKDDNVYVILWRGDVLLCLELCTASTLRLANSAIIAPRCGLHATGVTVCLSSEQAGRVEKSEMGTDQALASPQILVINGVSARVA